MIGGFRASLRFAREVWPIAHDALPERPGQTMGIPLAGSLQLVPA